MNIRGRLAIAALTVLTIYLLSNAVRVGEENRRLQKEQRAALSALSATQQNVVDQLAKILEQAALAEAAGQAAQGSVARILERVQGLDPALIKRAIDQAAKKSGRPIVGPQGPPGPPGPAATTTSTVPATTTSTTRPPITTTSTTRPPTTTTTRCVAGIGQLLRLGCSRLWVLATDPSLLELAKWGPAGIVILGFASGWLWAKPAVERLQKDLDQALADLREVRREQRELEKAQREIVIPAITRFIEVGEKLQERLGP